MAGFGDTYPVIGETFTLPCKEGGKKELVVERIEGKLVWLRSISDGSGLWRWTRTMRPYQTRSEKAPVLGRTSDAPLPPELRRAQVSRIDPADNSLEARVAALEAEHRSFAARMLALEAHASDLPAPRDRAAERAAWHAEMEKEKAKLAQLDRESLR